MQINNEQELLSTLMTKLPALEKALVFAPHPDDEVFGCGGTIAMLQRQGVRVSVVVITDGALGGDNSDGCLPAKREGESNKALAVLGLDAARFWRIPDQGLVNSDSFVSKLTDAIEETAADLIFLPAPTEIHPDHTSLAVAGTEALNRLSEKALVAYYEVDAYLSTPNFLVDISPVEQLKCQAMEQYSSQLDEYPYIDRVSGNNRLRGLQMKPQVQSAEAFLIVDSQDAGKAIMELQEDAILNQQVPEDNAVADGLPLVSIIVRSMDRDYLPAALNSLAQQVYPRVEIVLVNAKGGLHSDVGRQYGRYPLHLVNQKGAPLGRAQAANAGLKACSGKYIGFLDDDDVLTPNHIYTLVEALEETSELAVAYSGTQLVDRSDMESAVFKSFYESDVTFVRYLFSNPTPIHSVLFPSALLEKGVVFDESFTLCEDWDFWLQMSRVAPFIFVDQLSAIYHSGGDSGASPLSTSSVEKENSVTAVFEKWLPMINAEEMKLLSGFFHEKLDQLKVSKCKADVLEQQVANLESVNLELVTEAQKNEKELNILIEVLQEQLESIINSRSWVITRPLRVLFNLFRSRRIF